MTAARRKPTARQPPMGLGRRPSAHEALQRAVADLLDKVLLPPALWSAFPAGGGGAVRGAILNGLGLKSGWPDLLIVHDRLYGMELKTGPDVVGPAQHEIHAALRRLGHHVAVIRTIDDAIFWLGNWGLPTRLSQYADKGTQP